MIFVGWDSETHLISPGCLAPKLVCGTDAVRVAPDKLESNIYLRPGAMDALHSLLRNPNIVILGANLPFDMGVACAERPDFIPLVFDAYDQHRARCVQTLQKLIDVALGMRKFRRFEHNGVQVVTHSNYALADLVSLYFQRHLEKADTWRLRYALLDGKPLEEWPPDAVAYAIQDAEEALLVHEAQVREMVEHWGAELPNQVEQQRAHWALYLMSMWGVRAEQAYVDRFIDNCRNEVEKMHRALACCDKCGAHPDEHDDAACSFEDIGIFRVERGKHVRTMTEIRRRVIAACERQGIPVPMTEPSKKFPEGQVSTDKDTLQETDDPHLHILAESMSFQKHLDQWGPVCSAAVLRPVCASYNVLVETGRTSCGGSQGQEGTNMQNPPRKGDVRPCFVPRAGWVYCSTDADTVELRAHAQNCLELLGWSQTAEYLKKEAREKGPDLHLVLASQLVNVSPAEGHARYLDGDKEMDDARQFAKCFHPETEVLTKSGWKRIDALTPLEEVAQAFPADDGAARLSWVVPTQVFTRHHTGKLAHLRNEGIDLRVTPDHRMLVWRGAGFWDVCVPADVPSARGWSNAGTLRDRVTYHVDERLLRLAVATQADGSYVQNGHQIRFGFTKERKIVRLREMLSAFEGWREQVNADGVTTFIIDRELAMRVKGLLDEKRLPWRWLGLSQANRLVVLEEARFWDSYSPPNGNAYIYTSVDRQNTDVLQALAAISGRKTRCMTKVCEDNRNAYNLSVKDHAHTRGEKVEYAEEDYDGPVSCLSVPSSFVLVRANGVTLLCGQCPNYGFPGGLGAPTFVTYAAAQMDKETFVRWLGATREAATERAKWIRETWFATFPENRLYFKKVGQLIDPETGYGTVEQLMSRRIRGGVRFTAAANGYFQGRVADAMKEVLFDLSYECYTGRCSRCRALTRGKTCDQCSDGRSVLLGSRGVMFLHDEPILEHPEDGTESARAERQQRIVLNGLERWMPDVPVGSTPVLMRRWVKGAKPVKVNGLLVPSRPEKVDAGNGKTKTIWVHDKGGA